MSWHLWNNAKRDRKYPEIKAGQMVRIKINPKRTARGHEPTFTKQIYKVSAIQDDEYFIPSHHKQRMWNRHELLKFNEFYIKEMYIHIYIYIHTNKHNLMDELRKCSRRRSVIELKYFGINRKGEHNKTCINCSDKKKERDCIKTVCGNCGCNVNR